MEPIVIDPNTYDKQAAFDRAVEFCAAFLDANGLKRPEQVLTGADDVFPAGKNPWRRRGWYDFASQTVNVNLKNTRPPVKTPGFAWSFTGSKADLTAPGVVAHEHGHHVHNVLERSRILPKALLALIGRVRNEEPAVSGYEPNAYEAFAEAVRLFVLNPELLREGRPKRWDMLYAELGLRPVHSTPWREVLVHAHPKLVTSLERWAERG